MMVWGTLTICRLLKGGLKWQIFHGFPRDSIKNPSGTNKQMYCKVYSHHNILHVDLMYRLRGAAPHRVIPAPLRCSHFLVRHEIRRLKQAKQNSWSQPKRGKTTTSIKLNDLPQGKIPLEPIPLERDEPDGLSKVLQQAYGHMRKFENCVLLTRVGGFYEMYFEHAEEYGPLLNLKVAAKPYGSRGSGRSVPMVCQFSRSKSLP